MNMRYKGYIWWRSVERTCELIKQAKEGNKEAQSILVEENSGLIWSVVKRFQGR